MANDQREPFRFLLRDDIHCMSDDPIVTGARPTPLGETVATRCPPSPVRLCRVGVIEPDAAGGTLSTLLALGLITRLRAAEGVLGLVKDPDAALIPRDADRLRLAREPNDDPGRMSVCAF